MKAHRTEVLRTTGYRWIFNEWTLAIAFCLFAYFVWKIGMEYGTADSWWWRLTRRAADWWGI